MKVFKVLLVGYGNMGREWNKVICQRDDVRVIAVVDPLEMNRLQAVKEFDLNERNTYISLETALIASNPDMIIDSSPPFAHFTNTSVAINRRIPILGEKPIALTTKEAEEIVELSTRNDVLYMVNQNYRRNPIVTILKKSIESIGKLYAIEIDYHQILDFKDTFRYKINHPLLLDMAIHHFDLVRYMAGLNARTVLAVEHNPPTSKFVNGSDLNAIFKMDDNVILSYRGSWSALRKGTSYNGYWSLIGKKGTVSWDGDNVIDIELGPDFKKSSVRIPKKDLFDPYSVFLFELNESLSLFLESIKKKSLPDCWCGDNILSLKMVLGACASSENNLPMPIV